jgi:hypothetical protein
VANLDVSTIWENPLFLKIIEISAVDPAGVATHELELIAAHSLTSLETSHDNVDEAGPRTSGTTIRLRAIMKSIAADTPSKKMKADLIALSPRQAI